MSNMFTQLPPNLPQRTGAPVRRRGYLHGRRVLLFHGEYLLTDLRRLCARAQTSAFSVFGLERLLEHIPLPQGLKIYAAHIDSHLIFAADVVIDIDAKEDKKLQKVQYRCLRRLLQLHPRSSVRALFTETGLIHVQYRRLTLVLRFLRDVLALPDDAYPRLAMMDSADLYLHGKSCWVGDLHYALRRLHVPVTIPPIHTLNPDAIEQAIRGVQLSHRQWLVDGITESAKLYLLRNRVEPLPNGNTDLFVSYRRHYLEVLEHHHRAGITRILTGAHTYALETLRHRVPKIPRSRRRCRLCASYVESPEHHHGLHGLPPAHPRARARLRGVSTPTPTREPRRRRRRRERVSTHIATHPGIARIAKFIYFVGQLFHDTPYPPALTAPSTALHDG